MLDPKEPIETGDLEETPVPRPIKNMHIIVPQDLHKKVKMMCVIKNTTLKEFTELALREKLERDEKGLKL